MMPMLLLKPIFLDRFAFQYCYDGRQRMVMKKVPGTEGETHMVYDILDRLVLSQDANQRTRGEWTFTKYDQFSRPVMTGFFNSASNRAALQSSVGSIVSYEDEAVSIQELPAQVPLELIRSTHRDFISDGPNKIYQAQDKMVFQPGFTFASTGEELTIRLGTEDGQGTPGQTTCSLEASNFPALSPGNHEVLSLTFYDNYDFNGNGSADRSFDDSYNSQISPVPQAFTAVKGQITATKVKVLGSDNIWLNTVTFYDDRYRVIQTQADNHQGGIDILTTAYQTKLVGWVSETYLHHQTSYEDHTVKNRQTYDHTGRVLATFQDIDDQGEEQLSALEYNELGQLITKNLGQDGGAPLETVTYRYNIRGWMEKINDLDNVDHTAPDATRGSLFAMELVYDQDFRRAGNVGKANFNGNITGIKWKSHSDGTARSYAYAYDPLNRLIAADYAGSSQANPNHQDQHWTLEQDQFSVESISYDANGNITFAKRRGLLSWEGDQANPGKSVPVFGLMDDLSYTYSANRLIGVDDALDTPTNRTGIAGDFHDGDGTTPVKFSQGNEYTYDPNGNLRQDNNKGITSISYNHLNLPTIIDFGAGNRIEYSYDAAGVKLSKSVIEGGSEISRTDYVGGFLYENDVLQFIHTAEGRALSPHALPETSTSDFFVYEYHYKDHLGNLRVSFRKPSGAREYVAGMEPTNQQEEESEFLNIAQTRHSVQNNGWASSGTRRRNV
ncbi:MAG: hypothetical protein HC880_08515 [Bacteroidia bacterium]|nr:hypothetical protein [Bacteroidia bacterium]